MKLVSIRLLLIAAFGFMAMNSGYLVPLNAIAQTPLGGFSKNNKEPIDIQSDELEIRQAESLAIFTGGVVVVQGDLEVRSAKLIVKYHMVGEGENRKREIKHLDATGGVIVTNVDQSATGDWATMDTLKNVIVMGDNVVLTQGDNVINGSRLLVDLNTGYSRIISAGKDGGRVKAIFKSKKK